MKKKFGLSFLIFLYFQQIFLVFAQSQKIDFNQYYAFPFSLGIGYNAFLPEENNQIGYELTEADLCVVLRKPLAAFPWFQPGVRGGVKQVTGRQTFPGRQDNDMWDHTHLYGAIECALDYRFSKYWEAAFFSSLGFSITSFFNLMEDTKPTLIPYLHAAAGFSLIVNPMFNFSIDLHPQIDYQQAFSALNVLDGFSFSIGSTLHFRFGDDPDVNKGRYRIIKVFNKNMQPVFAAMQSYYVNNAAGSIRIGNTQKEDITDIGISFYQAGYMDNATSCVSIPVLQPGEQAEVALLASYNNEIFKTQGITPLSGEIRITYTYKGKNIIQSEPVTYDLYDKNSLVWDDDRKITAFITPADEIIKGWGSFTSQACREVVLPYYNNQIQSAMGIYSALEAADCLYQVDPITPYR